MSVYKILATDIRMLSLPAILPSSEKSDDSLTVMSGDDDVKKSQLSTHLIHNNIKDENIQDVPDIDLSVINTKIGQSQTTLNQNLKYIQSAKIQDIYDTHINADVTSFDKDVTLLNASPHYIECINY